jgi:hypothetical protein
MMTMPPPEELDMQVSDGQVSVENQLFTSLLRLGDGSFANHALQRTAAGHCGCNRGVPCAGPLSLGR